MKSMMFALAALAAFQAAAITATKEYVDRRDTEIRTNAYTKAETDARIGELAPRTSLAPATNYVDALKADLGNGTMAVHTAEIASAAGSADRATAAGIAESLDTGTENRTAATIFSQIDSKTTTNDVCGIVSNITDGAYLSTTGGVVFGAVEINDGELDVNNRIYAMSANFENVDVDYGLYVGEDTYLHDTYVSGVLSVNDEPVITSESDPHWSAEKGSYATTNYVDSATNSLSKSFAQTITNIVTKSYVEGLGIEAGISADTATNIAESVAASATSNIVTKSYVEGLGIESGISAETATNIAETAAAEATEGLLSSESDPVWSSEKYGYATTDAVSNVSESVGMLWSYVNRDNVWIAVTNYMRSVVGVSPSLQLWEVRDGETNMVYWSKEEITNVTHDLIHDCKTNLEATVQNAVAEMPDKAWSKYQSATGNEAPDGVTIVSTPTIQLTGGGEWYRYVDVASNSVWFLKSNGLHTFGGDTNGYFRILDDEGNATFEVRKTDSYLVDAVASSVHFDGDGNFCVSFESNIQPVIYTTASLSAPNFLPEGDDPNVTVTWTQSGGVYTATLEQAVKGPSLFAYAKVEVQGETLIRNSVPTDVTGGILCTDGVHKCRPVYNNGSIVWEVVP